MDSDCTKLFLFRHGEVADEWRGRIYGALDVPLSERGRSESRQAAGLLSGITLAAVISSGLQRAEHLAECLRAPRGLPRRTDPALRELERGTWAGRTAEEVQAASPGAWERWFRAPEQERPEHGENLLDLFLRVRPAVEHWAAQHSGSAIALATHGWVIRTLTCAALRAPLRLAPRLDLRTGDLVCLRWFPSSDRAPELEFFAGEP